MRSSQSTKRIAQTAEVKIPELIKLAVKEGHTDRLEIAKWIIAASPYWRSEGYNRIITELDRLYLDNGEEGIYGG